MLDKLKNYVQTEKGKYLTSCVIASLIIYNFFPILGILFPNTAGMFVFVLDLLVLNPLYVFITNLIISETGNYKGYMPVLIGILFLPTVFIFYNSSALIYIAIYIGLGFIASLIGNFIYKRIKK